MQSVNDIEMSYAEMDEMVGEMLKKKGFIGPGKSVEVSVMTIDRQGGVGFTLRVSVRPPEGPVEPSGPIPRGDVLLCSQASS